jgi:hypothetical protein
MSSLIPELNIKSPDKELMSGQKILHIDTDYNPENITPLFFYPAGSLSSHRDSLFDAQEDLEIPPECKLHDKYPTDDDEGSVYTMSENIIDYEPISPTDQASSQPSSFEIGQSKFNFSLSQDLGCFPKHRAHDHRGIQTMPQPINFRLLFEDAQSKNSLSITSDRHLEEELSRLQDQLKEYVHETREMRSQLRTTKTASEKAVQTDAEEDPRVQKMRLELEDMVLCCSRYEEQNNELRQEIQLSAAELVKLDKSHHNLQIEVSELRGKCSEHDDELRKLVELADQVAEFDRSTKTWESKNEKHLYNYLASTLEVIRSRVSRNKAKYDQLFSEKSRILDELNRIKATFKAQSSESDSLVHQLKLRLKAKDDTIQKLEKQILEYKAQASKQKDKKPSAQVRSRTESIVRSGSKYIIEHTEPQPHNHSGESTARIFKVESRDDPYDLSRITEESGSNHPSARNRRPRYSYDSDEELYTSKYASKRESLNNTTSLDSIQATPTHNFTSRNPTARNLDQAPLRDALKDLRDITSRAHKAITDSNQIRQNMKQTAFNIGTDINSLTLQSAVPISTKGRDPTTPKVYLELLAQSKHKANVQAKAREAYYEEMRKKYGTRSPYSPKKDKSEDLSVLKVNRL